MSMALSDMVDQLSPNSAVLCCSSRRLKSDGREETIPVGPHRLLLVGICKNTVNFIFILHYITLHYITLHTQYKYNCI